jgi:hypothetical protein
VHQTELLSASLLLLLAASVWGLHKIATAGCLDEEGCALPTSPTRPEAIAEQHR